MSSNVFKELAMKNVRKSAREYLIYFFTLMLGVCLFYTFNSISAQLAMLQIEDTFNFMAFASGMIMMISVFICVIIGFLIVYANRFLLKRRKKEIGIYITLGMEQKDIRGLLMRETLIIGAASLISGIVAGIFLSQGLSLVTAKITGTAIRNIHIIVSAGAIVKSIIFFGIVFFFVHRFNTKEIKKMKLIDLIYAEKKNESLPSSKGKEVAVFLLSLVLMAAGCAWIIVKMSDSIRSAISIGMILVSTGTVLFFLSVSGIAFRILSKRKTFYYKGMNMFVLQQLSSKIKSAGISMAVISILIFLSVTTMAIGVGGGTSISKDVKTSVPYDISFDAYKPNVENEAGPLNKVGESLKTLERAGISPKELFQASAELPIYEMKEIKGALFLNETKEKKNTPLDSDMKLSVVGVEDYNRAMKLQNKPEIQLGVDEFAVNCNMKEVKAIFEDYFKNSTRQITLQGKKLRAEKDGLYFNVYQTQKVLVDSGTIILPQEFVKDMEPVRMIVNANFKGNEKAGYQLFLDTWDSSQSDYMWSARQEVQVETASDMIIFSYIGMYLGIIFLITAGAVLALQQLSQFADNVKRYAMLKKLGTKKEDMKKSIIVQLAIYFGLPLIVSMIHASVVIGGIYGQITNLTIGEMVGSASLAVGITGVIYSIYFVTTYVGSRRIIEE